MSRRSCNYLYPSVFNTRIFLCQNFRGLDIASLSIKKLVQKIVLISGDSDFVPAAKLARREGIYFILDPMRNPIKEDLKEYIDWLVTRLPNLQKQQNLIKTTSPTKP